MEKAHKQSDSRGSKGSESNKWKARDLHKDWRTWLAVVLMLTAMGIYVLTLDDSVEGPQYSQDYKGR